MPKQRHNFNRSHRLIPALSAAALLLTVIGCMTIEQIAPPLLDTPNTRTLASSAGISLEQATRGRHIYITDCIKCHSPEPVARYTRVEWDEILPRMAEESNLPPKKTADIAAYIRLTLMLDKQGAVRTANLSERP